MPKRAVVQELDDRDWGEVMVPILPDLTISGDRPIDR
jgi:hypothetical protein